MCLVKIHHDHFLTNWIITDILWSKVCLLSSIKWNGVDRGSTCQWTASDDAEIKAAHACHDASLWQRVWSPRRNRLSANHQAGETQSTIRNYDLLKNTEFTNTFVVPLYFNYLTTQPSFTVVNECPKFCEMFLEFNQLTRLSSRWSLYIGTVIGNPKLYDIIWLRDKQLEIFVRRKRLAKWWRHQMETFSALLAICAGNSPVTGEFPAQRPVTRSFDVSFDMRLNKRFSKPRWGWWFETPSHPLWRHCNELCCEQLHWGEEIWRVPGIIHTVLLYLYPQRSWKGVGEWGMGYPGFSLSVRLSACRHKLGCSNGFIKMNLSGHAFLSNLGLMIDHLI